MIDDLTANVPGAPNERTPGYTVRVRQIVARAAESTTHTATFGFDVLDTIDRGYGAFGFDVIDVIEDDQNLPRRCGCGVWLMGPEAVAARKCWRCRS